jgi:hypothetical protein
VPAFPVLAPILLCFFSVPCCNILHGCSYLLNKAQTRMLLQEVVLGEDESKDTENVFVGGKNKWKFSSFVNWEFWWPSFPVLVYFKETQTKPEGQIHFFPIIFDGKTLYDTMVERCGPTQTSGRK